MKAAVNVRDGGAAARLPELASSAPAYATHVFAASDAAADGRVSEIIAANQSAAAPAVARQASAAAALLAAARAPVAARPLH
jgi:hypothetical protein